MSGRTTLILLIILVVVAGAVYWIEFRQPASPAVTASSSSETTNLLSISSPAISGITVRDVVSGTQVSATRDVSGTWWLAQPAGKPADPATLNSLATQLSSIYVQRTLTPTGSLSDFGLVTPTLVVDVNTTSGPASFGVGDMTPSKGAYYAQKTGDPHVYLIDTGVVDQLKQFASKPPVAEAPTPEPTLEIPSPVPTPSVQSTP